jgi:hypothetical protein
VTWILLLATCFELRRNTVESCRTSNDYYWAGSGLASQLMACQL